MEADEEFSPAEQKRIKRKIDNRLIVTAGVMYCVSLMDRTNLSAAAIAGMREEMVLIDYRYVSSRCMLKKTAADDRSQPSLLCSSSHMSSSNLRQPFYAENLVPDPSSRPFAFYGVSLW